MKMSKKTKIVATVSDLHCIPEFVRELCKAGVNVIRLNTAHQEPGKTREMIRTIRQVSDRIAILIDTKGPEIRTTKTKNIIELETGDEIMLKGNPQEVSTRETIYVNYAGIANDVKPGDSLLIDDGEIELSIVDISCDEIKCKATNNGIIKGNKSVNIPNVSVKLPALNEKDKKYIDLAVEEDIEFIAHSFVRNKQDIIEIQDILNKHDSRVKIIAKIENQEGVDNIDEILEHAYGIMVARGDLAVEIPYEKIPGIQKMLINKCIETRKPVIIATQMMHSMIDNPRPTRAEVSDVANAIYSKTDAIMLSGETAYGKYPIETVKTMVRIAKEVEKTRSPFNDIPVKILTNEISAHLTRAATESAVNLDCKAIVADSASGRTIRALASYRPKTHIFAQCYNQRLMRELALSYGVCANYMQPRDTTDEFIRSALDDLMQKKDLLPDDRILVLAGNFGEAQGASFIEISTVQNILKINLR